jgi:hypothetical protein
MNKIEIISPVFIAIGTIGLLLNEYVTHWGTIVTLTFAGFSIVGLIAFVASQYRSVD